MDSNAHPGRTRPQMTTTNDHSFRSRAAPQKGYSMQDFDDTSTRRSQLSGCETSLAESPTWTMSDRTRAAFSSRPRKRKRSSTGSSTSELSGATVNNEVGLTPMLRADSFLPLASDATHQHSYTLYRPAEKQVLTPIYGRPARIPSDFVGEVAARTRSYIPAAPPPPSPLIHSTVDFLGSPLASHEQALGHDSRADILVADWPYLMTANDDFSLQDTGNVGEHEYHERPADLLYDDNPGDLYEAPKSTLDPRQWRSNSFESFSMMAHRGHTTVSDCAYQPQNLNATVNAVARVGGDQST